MIRIIILAATLLIERSRERLRNSQFRSLRNGAMLFLLGAIEIFDNLIHYILSLMKLFLIVVFNEHDGCGFVGVAYKHGE